MESYSPLSLCTKLLSLEAHIVSTCIFSLVSPVINLIFPRRAGGGGGSLLLGRIAVGLLAAAYVGMVLLILVSVAAAVGVGLVRAWMEEPLYVRESLQFDYRDAHPTALANAPPVPPAHTLYVSLLLLMPDSDYNRDVGIFQLSAELISSEGNTITKSSHPSMLVFRSWPIRYTRTFLMGVPLLLGITAETQRISFPILKHKEAPYPRTEQVRITLFPRATTSALPQFYDAQIVLRSRPPWTKEVVYNWKLTFCVWTTMCIFLMLVMVLMFFLKPLIFPPFAKSEQADLGEERRRELAEEESLKRSRSKRKAAAAAFLLHGEGEGEGEEQSRVCSSASSITDNYEVGCGDSESVCS